MHATLSTMLLALMAPTQTAPAHTGNQPFTVIYLNNRTGEVDPCG